MEKNVGSTDKIVRIILGVALVVLGIVYIENIWGIIGLIVGVVLTGTALLGRCALYIPFGISTCAPEEKKD